MFAGSDVWLLQESGKKSLLGFALQTSHSALLLQYFNRADACSPSPYRTVLAPGASSSHWTPEKGLGCSGLKNHPSEQLDIPSAFCLLEACVDIFF